MREAIGSDIGPEMQTADLPKRSKLGDNPQVADAIAPEPQQAYRPWEPARVLPPICPQPVYASEILATRTVHETVVAQSLLTIRCPPSRSSKISRLVTAEQRSPHDSIHEWLTTATADRPHCHLRSLHAQCHVSVPNTLLCRWVQMRLR